MIIGGRHLKSVVVLKLINCLDLLLNGPVNIVSSQN